jgi:hypothetical protein
VEEKEAAGSKEDVVAEPMEEWAGRCSGRGAVASLDSGLVLTVVVTPRLRVWGVVEEMLPSYIEELLAAVEPMMDGRITV